MERHELSDCDEPVTGPFREPPGDLINNLRVIGGKWKLLILWYLFQRDSRFSELRRALPRITQHMLTAQLRELEADGIISRTAYAEIPPRVVYALTDHGRSLKVVLLAIYHWGARYTGQPSAAVAREKTSMPKRDVGQAQTNENAT